MPFRRIVGKYNLAVLVALACLVLALISVLGLTLALHGSKMSERAFDVNMKIISNAAILFGLMVVLIRQTAAVDYSKETRAAVQDAAAEVKKATNGELDKRIADAAKQAITDAIPTIVSECRCKCNYEKGKP